MRSLLSKCGIDINDGDNGVYLPNVKPADDVTEDPKYPELGSIYKNWPNATYHPTMHTKTNYTNVWKRLASINTSDANNDLQCTAGANRVRQELGTIALEYLEGTFQVR